jgi:hypothetical protein
MAEPENSGVTARGRGRARLSGAPDEALRRRKRSSSRCGKGVHRKVNAILIAPGQ